MEPEHLTVLRALYLSAFSRHLGQGGSSVRVSPPTSPLLLPRPTHFCPNPIKY
jgi:hypothetical protein